MSKPTGACCSPSTAPLSSCHEGSASVEGWLGRSSGEPEREPERRALEGRLLVLAGSAATSASASSSSSSACIAQRRSSRVSRHLRSAQRARIASTAWYSSAAGSTSVALVAIPMTAASSRSQTNVSTTSSTAVWNAGVPPRRAARPNPSPRAPPAQRLERDAALRVGEAASARLGRRRRDVGGDQRLDRRRAVGEEDAALRTRMIGASYASESWSTRLLLTVNNALSATVRAASGRERVDARASASRR